MKQLRKILFPFAGVYYLITLSRNWMYDRGLLKSQKYDFPVICVGNLNTGGTGKSPMTEYLIRLFQKKGSVATLSRGYGRKTKGYIKVTPEHTAAQVGDEPLQFARKYHDATVAVCEDRRKGITQIIHEIGEPEVLVLDDAFQHRKVSASFNVLLTAYGDVYAKDFLLPAGNLREPRAGARRADVIVVTKCDKNISETERNTIKKTLSPSDKQQLFFTCIDYSLELLGDAAISIDQLQKEFFLLVTGIANPKPLVSFLEARGLEFEHKAFGDHHNFALSEIETLDKNITILTTEKDYMRLKGAFKKARLYYIPIEMKFVEGEEAFDKALLNKL